MALERIYRDVTHRFVFHLCNRCTGQVDATATCENHVSDIERRAACHCHRPICGSCHRSHSECHAIMKCPNSIEQVARCVRY